MSFMARETRAIQDDDTHQSGLLWVLDGEGCGTRRRAPRIGACAACPTATRTSMKGVAARYPASTPRAGAQSIWNSASTSAAPSGRRHRRLPFESRELLALTAYVARNRAACRSISRSTREPRRFSTPAGKLFHRRQAQLQPRLSSATTNNWGSGSQEA